MLKISDFNPDDKMNVDAGKRLCDERVIQYINDEGLKWLMKLLRGFIDAFECSNLTVKEKILKVSYLISLQVPWCPKIPTKFKAATNFWSPINFC